MSARWEMLFPEEFLQRIDDMPVVYLPMGICEPHGHAAVMGLDTIKANYLCDEAANLYGGIVAPTLGYQMHESGFHAKWLSETVGNTTSFMTAMPPHVMLYFFLYQLRAFHNAGFRLALTITGHAGGNQKDYRRAAALFQQHSDMKVIVAADPELVEGQYAGDHAGKYELSQLLAIDKSCVNLSRLDNSQSFKVLGRFAQDEEGRSATAQYGRSILEDSLLEIKRLLDDHKIGNTGRATRGLMSYEEAETIWKELWSNAHEWDTANPGPGDQTNPASQWAHYDRPSIYHPNKD